MLIKESLAGGSGIRNCFDSIRGHRLYSLVCKADGNGRYRGWYCFYGSIDHICSIYDEAEKEIFLNSERIIRSCIESCCFEEDFPQNSSSFSWLDL